MEQGRHRRHSRLDLQRGLAGDDEITLLQASAIVASSRPGDTRGIAIIDTLHPVYEGRVFYWSGEKPLETLVSEYEPTAGSAERVGLAAPFTTCSRAARTRCAGASISARRPTFRFWKSAAGGPDRLARHGRSVSTRRRPSARWTASCRAGRRRGQAASPMPTSRRSAGSFRCWALPSSPCRSRASPSRWSRRISAVMPGGAC